MRVADYVAERCAALTNHVFMFVGGGSMYLNDAIGKTSPYICMHHEQSLAIAAEGYARITGRPSVCVVTTGPGGTNTITGVYGAWVDSIPMLFISGQVRTGVMNRGLTRQIADQEVDIVQLVKPLTKYAATCMDPSTIDEMFDTALYSAISDRPGPSWLDIPLDIQRAEFEPPLSFSGLESKSYSVNMQPVIKALTDAKRPLIIAGNGIRLAHCMGLFWSVAKGLHIPIIPDFNARDLGQFDFPTFGLQGHQKCNDIIQEADVILILGCRMSLRQVGWNVGELGRNATKIMVDIDSGELNKHTFIPDMKICTDLPKALIPLLELKLDNMWASPVAYDLVTEKTSVEPVQPPYFIQVLNKHTQDGDIVAIANGVMPTVAVQRLAIKPNMRLLLNSGCGAMGWGLPAAIGAAFASKKRVICLEGDGSLQLNIQDLQTIVHHNLPIKLFIGDNGGYASIRNTQDNYFNGHYVGADITSGLSFPSLSKIAAAYGIPYKEITTDKEADRVIGEVLGWKGPIICNVKVDPRFKLDRPWITFDK